MQAERPSDIMRRARAFADLHVREGAAELLEWHSTGKLRGGRVRELAVMYRPITDTDTIQFAEREFEKAALRASAGTLDAAPSEPSAEHWRRAIADIFGPDMPATVEQRARERAKEGK